VSSGKVEENHGCIRATEGEVYIRSGKKELGLEGASRCYIWDGDWVITHVPRDKPYGRQTVTLWPSVLAILHGPLRPSISLHTKTLFWNGSASVSAVAGSFRVFKASATWRSAMSLRRAFVAF
jgi:hypothetical protein